MKTDKIIICNILLIVSIFKLQSLLYSSENSASIFNEIGNHNKMLAAELQKIPELKDNITDKEKQVLIYLKDFYLKNTHDFDTAFSEMMNVGLPQKRSYCSPLQSILWLIEDYILPNGRNANYKINTITIDGFLDDWKMLNIAPACNDNQDSKYKDFPTDIKAIYAFFDDKYFYIAFETFGNIDKSAGYLFQMDTDGDDTFDYSIGVRANGYTWANRNLLKNGEPEVEIKECSSAINDIAEIKVPLSILNTKSIHKASCWILRYQPIKLMDQTDAFNVKKSTKDNFYTNNNKANSGEHILSYFIKNPSLDYLLRYAWSGYFDERWNDFEIVAERLNAPELLVKYVNENYKYIGGVNQSPKETFKKKSGQCISLADFGEHVLKKAGYKTFIRSVDWEGIYLGSDHSGSGIILTNGSYLLVVDWGYTSTTQIKGPFKTVADLDKALAGDNTIVDRLWGHRGNGVIYKTDKK